MEGSSTNSRHALARRQGRLADLRRYLAMREQEFELLRATLYQFTRRYQGELEPLHTELDSVEQQLHAAMSCLGSDTPRPASSNPLPSLTLAQLPPSKPLPAEPVLPTLNALRGQPQAVLRSEPPSLKQLYRRAAMRMHPDHASNESERLAREQSMMAVNEAYARADRSRLEGLLRASGDSEADSVDKEAAQTGELIGLRLDWLQRAEHVVQERLDLVKRQYLRLVEHPVHTLWQSVGQAEARGQRPLSALAGRLRQQITERRRELYIGQRLQPGSDLAQAFLSERKLRLQAIH